MGDIPVIGIDLGFGRTKVAGPAFRTSFPALVAEPSTYAESTGMVEWGAHRYLVGEAALSEPHCRYSTRVDKIITPDEQAKFLVALAMASRHYDCRVFGLATGLPPAHYRHPLLKQQLSEAMTGTFDFIYEGTAYEITVAGATVDPQAGAALFDVLLAEDGEMAEPSLLESRTIVLDIGHKTCDVALMHGRKAAMGSRSLLTVEQGVWHVYEEMARLLFRRYRLALTPAEIDRHWRTGEHIKLAGNLIPLAPLMAEAVVPIARAITTNVARLAGDLRLWDQVLLVGGGAPLLNKVLSQELGIATRMPSNPEFANACGYFKRHTERR